MGNEEDIASRRHFLKAAATLGSLATIGPLGCSSGAAETLPPTKTISVIGAVDIAQALADNALANNLVWLDNNASRGSKNLGTDSLITSISRNSYIIWAVSGIEVETVAEIASITGPGASMAAAAAMPTGLGINIWVGQIPSSAAGIYEYSITLNVENRLMTIPVPLRLDVL